MKVCRPDFYREFQCIGSECTDTCCAQWEIEVDETSAERYAEDRGPLAEDFKKFLVRKEDENYFRLTEEKRCPFLNEQNLCRMILTMGEEVLCDICREHPRFYHWFGDYTEVGLGLCCEEAGRLLFSRKPPAGFELLSDGMEEDGANPEEDEWVELLLAAREQLICMLQNRELSLNERMGRMLTFAETVQPFLDEEDLEEMESWLENWRKGDSNQFVDETAGPDWSEASLRGMLSFYERLESLDGTWPEQMRKLRDCLPELVHQLPAFMEAAEEAGRACDYEHLLVYFVYRYFMEAVYDSNILSPLRFAAVSLQVILLLDADCWNSTGSFTLKDRIRLAKWYSKEIEYCPDNMELLAERLEESASWL